MATTELKRYKVKPESWDDFVSTWRDIVALRRKHGFGVLFALHDPETCWFTWVIEHQGDFAGAADGYYTDPDRVALDRIVEYVSEWEIRKVNAMSIP